MSKAAPPRLPRELYARSTPMALAFVAFTLGVWLLPGLAAAELVESRAFSWWQLSPPLLALAWLSSHGVHLAGWVGHEAFHFNLFRGRLKNAVVGIVVSSATVFFVETGVAIDHHNHHRHTNTEQDPDLVLFGRQDRFWSRLLLTRVRANRAFLRDAVRLLAGRPLEMDERGLPFGRATYRWLAAFNLLCCAGWLALYVLASFEHLAFIVCAVVLPLSFANVLTGLRPYLEHADTDQGVTSSARSRTSPWLVFWYFGNSLHLEHHLYPSVPCYRLPRVQRWLVAQGFLERDHECFEPGILEAYRWTSSRHAYGPPSHGAPS